MTNEDDDLYYIRVLEPISGQIRTVFLYNEITSEELSILLCAAFSEAVVLDKIIGLRDEETSIFYPLSILDRSGTLISKPILTFNYSNLVYCRYRKLYHIYLS